MTFMKEEENLITKYFDFLDSKQVVKLEQFIKILRDWNEKINLVSRSDVNYLVERHLLPSLAIAKVCKFASGSKILDVGTGGGFPGIPLAICFPQAQFLLIDSIGKKITVVNSIIQGLELKNVHAVQIRAEDLKEKFDFVVGRAVTALPKFIGWVKDKVRSGNKSSLSNGVLYLKGGDYSEEIEALGIFPTAVYGLSDLFNGEYCQDKCLIYFDQKSLN